MSEDRAGGVAPREEQTPMIDSWTAAVSITPVSPDSVERFIVFGVNVCVRFPEAFVAAYEMIKAGKSVVEASATQVLWPIAVWDCYRAARSVFSALVENMIPLNYVTAVILSRHKEGTDAATLEKEVNEFLDDPGTMTFGWHLSMTPDKVAQAGGGRYDGWFADVIPDLESKGFLTRNDTRLVPVQKNVEWKIVF